MPKRFGYRYDNVVGTPYRDREEKGTAETVSLTLAALDYVGDAVVWDVQQAGEASQQWFAAPRYSRHYQIWHVLSARAMFP